MIKVLSISEESLHHTSVHEHLNRCWTHYCKSIIRPRLFFITKSSNVWSNVSSRWALARARTRFFFWKKIVRLTKNDEFQTMLTISFTANSTLKIVSSLLHRVIVSREREKAHVIIYCQSFTRARLNCKEAKRPRSSDLTSHHCSWSTFQTRNCIIQHSTSVSRSIHWYVIWCNSSCSHERKQHRSWFDSWQKLQPSFSSS